jgi:hypothetical protein
MSLVDSNYTWKIGGKRIKSVYYFVEKRVRRDLQLQLPFEPYVVRKQPLRRRVFRLQLAPFADGSYLFKARSFSRKKGRSYRLRVNPQTGYVWCSCRDFHYRKEGLRPNYWDGPFCKHLARAVKTVRKVEREAEQLPLAA